MQKTTKGAMAAGAAAVLLLGGAGSLAYWSDSATGAAGSIDTGSLGLASGTCDSTWKFASGSASGVTASVIVPGDKITKDCTFVVHATGDHIAAKPSLPTSTSYTITSTPTPTTISLPVTASYAVDGTSLTSGSSITKTDDGKTLTAHIVVTMPYGDATSVNANDTQKMTASLNALKVVLTQAQGASNPEN